MTDKNLIDLTNEDIISSLEVIATTRNCNDCKIRNCKWGTCNCEQITANAALDLIKRQQAEIERLQTEIKRYTRYYYNHEYDKCEKEIKSEAVKEFQKNLKALYTDEFITDDMHCPVAVIKANIDDIAEEMVGDSDA